MSNKIDGSGPGNSRFPASRKDGAKERGLAGQSRAAHLDASKNSARIQVADTASQIKRLQVTLLSLSDVDESRVQEIRAKLASGDFEIDSARTAKNLIRFEKGFA